LYKQPKVVRVLDLWLKNGVYTSEIIQPLLDFTAAPHSSEVFRAGTFVADVSHNTYTISRFRGRSQKYIVWHRRWSL